MKNSYKINTADRYAPAVFFVMQMQNGIGGIYEF